MELFKLFIQVSLLWVPQMNHAGDLQQAAAEICCYYVRATKKAA